MDSIKQFKEGLILKMDVAFASHVKEPYYVEVIYFNPEAKAKGDKLMTTNIPGQHSLDMFIGRNWEYHYPRMTIVGEKKKFEHLLYNQKLMK